MPSIRKYRTANNTPPVRIQRGGMASTARRMLRRRAARPATAPAASAQGRKYAPPTTYITRSLLGALMADDVESLILRWWLEVGGDGVELLVGGPGSAFRRALAALPELTLAQRIRRVDEV